MDVILGIVVITNYTCFSALFGAYLQFKPLELEDWVHTKHGSPNLNRLLLLKIAGVVPLEICAYQSIMERSHRLMTPCYTRIILTIPRDLVTKPWKITRVMS